MGPLKYSSRLSSGGYRGGGEFHQLYTLIHYYKLQYKIIGGVERHYLCGFEIRPPLRTRIYLLLRLSHSRILVFI